MTLFLYTNTIPNHRLVDIEINHFIRRFSINELCIQSLVLEVTEVA